MIFCAENVCAQTPTKIFLPDENLVNTINKYQILTHRQKLKLKNSFFYRRIHLLKTKGKFPFEIRFGKRKIVGGSIFSQKGSPSTPPSTIIQWSVGAPKYYLFHSKTDTIIKTYPTHVCWKKILQVRNKNHEKFVKQKRKSKSVMMNGLKNLVCLYPQGIPHP